MTDPSSGAHYSGRLPTPHEQADMDAGQQLLTESISVGREFCKFMIGICTGAVPIYLSLVGLYLQEAKRVSCDTRIEIFIPVAIFMVAAAVFVYGYLPTRGNLSLDRLATIEQERNSAISRRFWCTVLGLLILAAGMIGGTWVLIRLLPRF